MAGVIYYEDESGKLVRMESSPYDSEDVLQGLPAEHPDLLAGEEMDQSAPRRWLLIRREMGVPAAEGEGDWWSVDHLFVDQDGVPTLVEVKRSGDTRARREVVAQMLDYAAHAANWPVDRLRTLLERSTGDGTSAVDEFLGPDREASAFWQDVKTNLQAGRVRMVFVADRISPELRQIVEFLNEQMDPAEVFAVEVRLFTGDGRRAFVPRVVGQTAAAQRRKGGDRADGSGTRRRFSRRSSRAADPGPPLPLAGSSGGRRSGGSASGGDGVLPSGPSSRSWTMRETATSRWACGRSAAWNSSSSTSSRDPRSRTKRTASSTAEDSRKSTVWSSPGTASRRDLRSISACWTSRSR